MDHRRLLGCFLEVLAREPRQEAAAGLDHPLAQSFGVAGQRIKFERDARLPRAVGDDAAVARVRGEPDAVALARDLYGRRAERIDVAARAGDQHRDVEGRQGPPRLRLCRDLPWLLLGG